MEILYKFKVGDRIIATNEFDGNDIRELKGTIIELPDNENGIYSHCYSIRFDEKRLFFHDCDKLCENNHGYWVPTVCLELLGGQKTDINKHSQSSVIIETLPYYLHSSLKWSDGKIDTAYEIIQSLTEKYIFNDNVTIAILECGSKGIAKCQPDDEYSKLKGMEIARAKAMIKSLQKDLKKLAK